ncbi:hypothetical protein CYMTET_32710 [Cymbomonas tetramitiformis]|uniref:Uncharacterized protein n=1 Tax=Cymbomonas tetramitiformis TaxID=36881 RepID=A0AAE0FEH9_9CHLO|nr:hypothetical protein CYMTET_32710 [Cymbomonas tetramitiformis]
MGSTAPADDPVTTKRVRSDVGTSDEEQDGDQIQSIQKGKRQKTEAETPCTGFFNVYGSEARARVEIKPNSRGFKLQDVQDLILWVLADSELETAPKWIFVQNKPLINRVVVVLAHGLEAQHLRDYKKQTQELVKRCGAPHELNALSVTITPGVTPPRERSTDNFGSASGTRSSARRVHGFNTHPP